MSHMPRINPMRALRRLFSHQQGVAPVEFALAAPLLLALLLGTLEITRYMMIQLKTDKVADTIADLVAQDQAIELTNANLAQLVTAATEVMNPYPFGAYGYVIISSVAKTGTAAPTVRWQYSGGGTFTRPSLIGIVNGNASMPAGFTMADKDNIIVTEVFYNYSTFFGSNLVGNSVLRKTSYYKPRLGALTSPPT